MNKKQIVMTARQKGKTRAVRKMIRQRKKYDLWIDEAASITQQDFSDLMISVNTCKPVKYFKLDCLEDI